MFVYFHWSKISGQQHVQAFHKADKAAEYVINQIEALAIEEGRNLGLQMKKKARASRAGGGDIDDIGYFDAAINIPRAPVPVGAVGAIEWGHFGGAPANVAMPDMPAAPQREPRLPKENTKKEQKKIPIELEKLRDHMTVAHKNKSIENAIIAIQLYEDFVRYALNSESSIHTLTDLKIVE